jgi:uncharacterized membrane protein
MSAWIAVLASSGIAYLCKLAGYVIPARWLAHPRIIRVTAMLPAALLAALVILQTFATGTSLAFDARAAGLAVAALALAARAPFIAVVVLAAGSAALLRALGWS